MQSSPRRTHTNSEALVRACVRVCVCVCVGESECASRLSSEIIQVGPCVYVCVVIRNHSGSMMIYMHGCEHRKNRSKLCTFFCFESDNFVLIDFWNSVFTLLNSKQCFSVQKTQDDLSWHRHSMCWECVGWLKSALAYNGLGGWRVNWRKPDMATQTSRVSKLYLDQQTFKHTHARTCAHPPYLSKLHTRAHTHTHARTHTHTLIHTHVSYHEFGRGIFFLQIW